MSELKVRYYAPTQEWATAYDIFRDGKWVSGAICGDLTAAEKDAAATIERLRLKAEAHTAQQKNVSQEVL
jgi:hypothetical protein